MNWEITGAIAPTCSDDTCGKFVDIFTYNAEKSTTKVFCLFIACSRNVKFCFFPGSPVSMVRKLHAKVCFLNGSTILKFLDVLTGSHSDGGFAKSIHELYITSGV